MTLIPAAVKNGMMLPIIAIVLSLVVFGESAFVDTLTKCSKNDEACHAKLMKKILLDISELGIPEFGIPPIDPMALNNQSVSILDVDITLNGDLKGIKKCAVNKYTIDFEHGIANMDLTFDLIFKGKYKVFSASQLIKGLLGGENVHGDGDAKVKIEKLNIKLTMPFEVKKRGDDIFLLGKKKKLTYSFDVLGRVLFAANKLYLGDKESSAEIVRFLNEQSKFLVQNFGKLIFDEAMNYVFDFTYKFFDNTPCKYFITEDLTSYAS